MNWLDLVILLIVAATAAMGLKIGLIRVTFTSLAIFIGSFLGVQLSSEIGGLIPGVDPDSVIATVISYAIMISLCLIAAAIASDILSKGLDVLSMGWADKLAGVALGVVAGGIISAVVILGMANLTYSSEIGDKFAAKILNSTLDTEKAKNRLEDGLSRSALVGILIDIVDVVPASTMSFLPSKFTSGLGVLELRQAAVAD